MWAPMHWCRAYMCCDQSVIQNMNPSLILMP
jgi:hypothetical protein